MAGKKRHFSKQLKINLTDESFEKVTLLAQEAGLTKSEFFREMINENTKNAQLPEKKEIEIIHKVDKKFYAQFCGIATNINQISARLNTINILEIRLLERVESKINLLLESAKK